MEHTRNPHLAIDRVVLITSVLLLGLGVTYAEINKPDWNKILHIQKKQTVTTAPSASTDHKDSSTTSKNVATGNTVTTQPTPTQPAASTPASTPPAAPTVKTTTTVSFVHMRAGKSTSTPILFDLDAGTMVILRDDSDSLWQGVTYQGKDGYIYKSYLQY